MAEEDKTAFLGCEVLLNLLNGDVVRGVIVDLNIVAPIFSSNGTEVNNGCSVTLRMASVNNQRIIDSLEIRAQQILNLRVLSKNKKLDTHPPGTSPKTSTQDTSVVTLTPRSRQKQISEPNPKWRQSSIIIKNKRMAQSLSDISSSKVYERNNGRKRNVTVSGKPSPSRLHLEGKNGMKDFGPAALNATKKSKNIIIRNESDELAEKYLETSPRHKSETNRIKNGENSKRGFNKLDISSNGAVAARCNETRPKYNHGTIKPVWTAPRREIQFYRDQNLCFMTVPSESLMYNKDKGTFTEDFKSKTQTYCGNFQLEATQYAVKLKALHPKEKMDELNSRACEIGYKFWIRTNETMGQSFSQIIMSTLHSRGTINRVLVVAGNNFQGAASIVAAKYLGLQKLEVYVYLDGSNTSGPIFEGTSDEDIIGPGVHILKSLEDVPPQVKGFQIVLFGMDNHNSPTTTLHLYKKWMIGAAIVIIEPPLIPKSYKRIIDKITGNDSNCTVLIIYVIRPSPCTTDEDARMYLVNVATNFPPVGHYSFNRVKQVPVGNYDGSYRNSSATVKCNYNSQK